MSIIAKMIVLITWLMFLVTDLRTWKCEIGRTMSGWMDGWTE